MNEKILLIIPCFNEAKRLDIPRFKAAPPHLHFLFANDGSTDGTKELLNKLSHEDSRFAVFHAPQNLGKANVTQAAFSELKKMSSYSDYSWIGFWDADLATPLIAVDHMLKFQEFYPDMRVDSIWGSRNSRLGSQIKRQSHRHYLGRIFVSITSLLLGVKAYDSQCGAKLFRNDIALIAFKDPFISRWIFDIEILLRLGKKNIVEFPLLYWEDIPGSKVKIFREIFRVFFDILKIRKHYLS